MLTPAPGKTLADTIATAARSMGSREPLTFVGHLGDDDAYRRDPARGGTLYVLMGIWSTMPPRLLAAVRARRVTSITGRCPLCACCVDLATGTYEHEQGCPVATELLGRMMRRWARRVGKYGRGRRLVEDPPTGARL
jgi:hypothetical protein